MTLPGYAYTCWAGARVGRYTNMHNENPFSAGIEQGRDIARPVPEAQERALLRRRALDEQQRHYRVPAERTHDWRHRRPA